VRQNHNKVTDGHGELREERSRLSALTHLANAKRFQPMTFDAEVQPFGKATQQCFKVAALKRDHIAATAAHQMMLVPRLSYDVTMFTF